MRRDPAATREPRDDEPGDQSTRLDAKKKPLIASERKAEERARWRAAIAKDDPRQFVFLDESGVNVPLTPRSARAPRGERAVAAVPRNYGQNTTVVAALTTQGIHAPMTLLGAMDSDAFAVSVAQVLVPTLHSGQLIICANLSVHKRADIRAQIEQAGCAFRFHPAYSSDFNPIEQAVSTVKSALRHAQARTQETLGDAITAALVTITGADALGWFHHAGYDLCGQPL